MVCDPTPTAELGEAFGVKFQLYVAQFCELVPLNITESPVQIVKLLDVICGTGPAKVPPFGLLLLKVRVKPVFAEKLFTSRA